MSKELQIRNSTVDFLVFTRDAREDGIEVRVQNGDVWLTQKAISQLFDVDRSCLLYTSIEKTFMDLMNLANSMNQEEKRYVREGFTSDEELSLYDMLFNENLSKEDINKIKKVAVDLLEKIKAKISELDHWTEKQETRDDIETYIGAILWEELPESYSDNAIFAYRQKIYEYVFMRYKEVA